jgi:hypothetical protein
MCCWTPAQLKAMSPGDGPRRETRPCSRVGLSVVRRLGAMLLVVGTKSDVRADGAAGFATSDAVERDRARHERKGHHIAELVKWDGQCFEVMMPSVLSSESG